MAAATTMSPHSTQTISGTRRCGAAAPSLLPRMYPDADRATRPTEKTVASPAPVTMLMTRIFHMEAQSTYPDDAAIRPIRSSSSYGQGRLVRGSAPLVPGVVDVA